MIRSDFCICNTSCIVGSQSCGSTPSGTNSCTSTLILDQLVGQIRIEDKTTRWLEVYSGHLFL